MSWVCLLKKSDPISEKARELNAEIAALESQIKKLGTQIEREPALTAKARVATQTVSAPAEEMSASDPVFEEVHQTPLKSGGEELISADHFNDQGVKKYDLPGLVRRVRSFFQGQPVSNPKFVNYLAAGSVQGLRPLRYERRVARNRFIFWTSILLLLLWGIIAYIAHRH